MLCKETEAENEIETEDTNRFVRESNLSIIQRYVGNDINDSDGVQKEDTIVNENNSSLITGLGKYLRNI
jgi:hypothetical protein